MALALVVGAGCIDSDVEVVSTADTGDRPPSGGEAPATTAGARLEVVAIGDEVTTAEGNEVTVHRFDYPVEVPGEDVELGVAEAEACAPEGGEGASVGPQAFRLQLDDDSRRHPVPVQVREPALTPQRIEPGGCARGWVAFPVGAGETPESVVPLASTVVEWTIP